MRGRKAQRRAEESIMRRAPSARSKCLFRMRAQPTVVESPIRLQNYSSGYTAKLDKKETKKRTRDLQCGIGEMQELLYANAQQAVLLLFQGLDASGKDGAIRSVLREVNPAGVQTANFKAPSEEERAHDFLWRVHHAVPRRGYLGIFNRSHYEAVLVERVIGELSKPTLKNRFRQIVEFERMLAENGVVLLKFYLHLGREEQRERLEERLELPQKNWKFSKGDLVVRSRWDDYMAAYEDMLNETSHRHAAWHVVPADHNWYRDFVIADATFAAMKALKLKWPAPREDLSKIKVE
jgi:PPK2 family polyphosphate:nucleotide phosphotransferase